MDPPDPHVPEESLTPLPSSPPPPLHSPITLSISPNFTPFHESRSLFPSTPLPFPTESTPKNKLFPQRNIFPSSPMAIAPTPSSSSSQFRFSGGESNSLIAPNAQTPMAGQQFRNFSVRNAKRGMGIVGMEKMEEKKNGNNNNNNFTPVHSSRALVSSSLVNLTNGAGSKFLYKPNSKDTINAKSNENDNANIGNNVSPFSPIDGNNAVARTFSWTTGKNNKVFPIAENSHEDAQEISSPSSSNPIQSFSPPDTRTAAVSSSSSSRPSSALSSAISSTSTMAVETVRSLFSGAKNAFSSIVGMSSSSSSSSALDSARSDISIDHVDFTAPAPLLSHFNPIKEKYLLTAFLEMDNDHNKYIGINDLHDVIQSRILNKEGERGGVGQQKNQKHEEKKSKKKKWREQIREENLRMMEEHHISQEELIDEMIHMASLSSSSLSPTPSSSSPLPQLSYAQFKYFVLNNLFQLPPSSDTQNITEFSPNDLTVMEAVLLDEKAKKKQRDEWNKATEIEKDLGMEFSFLTKQPTWKIQQMEHQQEKQIKKREKEIEKEKQAERERDSHSFLPPSSSALIGTVIQQHRAQTPRTILWPGLKEETGNDEHMMMGKHPSSPSISLSSTPSVSISSKLKNIKQKKLPPSSTSSSPFIQALKEKPSPYSVPNFRPKSNKIHPLPKNVNVPKGNLPKKVAPGTSANGVVISSDSDEEE